MNAKEIIKNSGIDKEALLKELLAARKISKARKMAQNLANMNKGTDPDALGTIRHYLTEEGLLKPGQSMRRLLLGGKSPVQIGKGKMIRVGA